MRLRNHDGIDRSIIRIQSSDKIARENSDKQDVQNDSNQQFTDSYWLALALAQD